MQREQDRMANPFGMDETCTNCPELVESRRTIVHGFGDVSAEFFFVLEAPNTAADRQGHPVASDDTFEALLARARFLTDERDADDAPVLDNAFITYLTRCRHPDRPPADPEIQSCDPFLTAELRSINPEILVPVGQRPLTELAREHTTRSVDELDVAEVHGEEIRGRGFELLPMVGRDALTEHRMDTFLDALETTMGRDYRQTKGRRSR